MVPGSRAGRTIIRVNGLTGVIIIDRNVATGNSEYSFNCRYELFPDPFAFRNGETFIRHGEILNIHVMTKERMGTASEFCAS